MRERVELYARMSTGSRGAKAKDDVEWDLGRRVEHSKASHSQNVATLLCTLEVSCGVVSWWDVWWHTLGSWPAGKGRARQQNSLQLLALGQSRSAALPPALAGSVLLLQQYCLVLGT